MYIFNKTVRRSIYATFYQYLMSVPCEINETMQSMVYESAQVKDTLRTLVLLLLLRSIFTHHPLIRYDDLAKAVGHVSNSESISTCHIIRLCDMSIITLYDE